MFDELVKVLSNCFIGTYINIKNKYIFDCIRATDMSSIKRYPRHSECGPKRLTDFVLTAS